MRTTEWRGAVGPRPRIRPEIPALVLAVAVAFALLAATAAFGDRLLLLVDLPVHDGVIEFRTGWLDTPMASASFLGSRALVGPLALLLTAWLLLARRRAVLAAAVVAVFVAPPVLEFALKVAVGRGRPDVLPLVATGSEAFPSGHATTATAFYGLLPTLAAWLGASRSTRWVMAAAAAVLIVAIAFSRLYLGVHWLTDVLGGVMLGAIVVALARAAIDGVHPADAGPPAEDRL